MAVADLTGLTGRQAAFVRAFLTPGPPKTAYLCATRAAAAAGYAWPGKQGPRLLSMPRVAAALEAACHEEFGELAVGRHEESVTRGPVHVGKP